MLGYLLCLWGINIKLLKQKTITMKKVFAILAVAGLMTACNNAAAPEVKADSTAKVDSTVKVDSSAVKVDSTAKVDSTKK